jgi:hypothetical protein
MPAMRNRPRRGRLMDLSMFSILLLCHALPSDAYRVGLRNPSYPSWTLCFS